MSEKPSMLSFEEAVTRSEELLDDIEKNGINEKRANLIADYLSTVPSARGFFVSLLAGSYTLADQPPVRFVELIRTGGDHLADLLAKNLVMSTAMKVYYESQKETSDAEGSAMVAQRTANIINLVKDSRIKSRLEDMSMASSSGLGPYSDFFSRMQYRQDQKSAIEASLQLILARW